MKRSGILSGRLVLARSSIRGAKLCSAPRILRNRTSELVPTFCNNGFSARGPKGHPFTQPGPLRPWETIEKQNRRPEGPSVRFLKPLIKEQTALQASWSLWWDRFQGRRGPGWVNGWPGWAGEEKYRESASDESPKENSLNDRPEFLTCVCTQRCEETTLCPRLSRNVA